MSHPVPSPAPRKTLTTPIIAALAALAVLAIVTVLVVINKDDSGSTSGSGTTSSSAASSKAPPADGKQVTSSIHNVRYTYPDDGYDGRTWEGPLIGQIGDVTVDDLVGLQSCSPTAGQDLLYGLVESTEDPEQAASSVATDLAKGVWSSQGDADTTDPTDPQEKPTNSGVKGQLVEIDSTRPTGPDQCGGSKVHIATFAFEADGGTVVFVASYRVDGDLSKELSDMEQDIADTIKSIELT